MTNNDMSKPTVEGDDDGYAVCEGEPTIEYNIDGYAAREAEKVALETARNLAEENANVRVREWFQAHLRPCSLCGGRSIGYATSLAITIGHPPSDDEAHAGRADDRNHLRDVRKGRAVLREGDGSVAVSPRQR